MMKKLVLTAVISALSLNAAYAYQVELNGNVGYGQVSTSGDDINTTGLGVNATYYFKNVTGNNVPLAEGAFSDRASNVSAGYGYSDSTLSGAPDVRVHDFNIAGEFYVPNSDFYASAGLNRPKIEGVASNAGAYTLEVGYLPITNLLVAVGVADTFNTSHNETDPTIRAKYLTQLNSNFVNLEGGAQFGDHHDSYHLKGDYYLDRTFSIGATYDLTTYDHLDNTYAIGVNARKFVASNISVQGGVSAGQYLGNNDFNVTVGGTYRF
ncbi:MAG: putative porin [Gammaproteobacteria bacterium]|nr:putative porin [Gammaproteobacteria bacterium]